MPVTVMTQTTPPDKDLPLYSSITDVSNSSLVISNKKLKEVNDILNKQIQNLEEEKHSSEARYLSILDKLADIKEEFSLCKLELQLAKEQIQTKEKEITAIQMEYAKSISKFNNKEMELESKNIVTEAKLASLQQNLETCDARYLDLVYQFSIKDQSVIDLQKKKDSLESSLELMSNKYKKEEITCTTLKDQLQEREAVRLLKIKKELVNIKSYIKTSYLVSSNYHTHALKKTKETITNGLQKVLFDKMNYSSCQGKVEEKYSSWTTVNEARENIMKCFKALDAIEKDIGFYCNNMSQRMRQTL